MVIAGAGCRRIHSVFKTQNPRKVYLEKIENSPLAGKPLLRQWKAAADSVLRQPVPVEIPFQTKMVFFNDEARAWAWQFKTKEGRKIRVHLNRSDSTQRLFVDIFSGKNQAKKLVKSTEDTLFSFTAEKNEILTLRIQPELLIEGSATLRISGHPSMAFPVQDGSHADIGGVYGDPRAGGARKHKGIDIFADRGTPVLAVANGRVSRTGNHGLGGKQVWLYVRGKAIYYAHLDSIGSHTGEHVQTGDTLGFVGNTGNARGGPTHLHFAIYEHGAIDPQPFVDFAHGRAEPVAVEPADFPKWGRITASKANVRPRPSTGEPPLTALSRNNPVMITGGTGQWYQVLLPDRTAGFIYQSLVKPADSKLKNSKITSADRLFYQFKNKTSRFIPQSTHTVGIYGYFEGLALIKIWRHWMWVK